MGYRWKTTDRMPKLPTDRHFLDIAATNFHRMCVKLIRIFKYIYIPDVTEREGTSGTSIYQIVFIK